MSRINHWADVSAKLAKGMFDFFSRSAAIGIAWSVGWQNVHEGGAVLCTFAILGIIAVLAWSVLGVVRFTGIMDLRDTTQGEAILADPGTAALAAVLVASNLLTIGMMVATEYQIFRFALTIPLKFVGGGD